MRISRTLRFGLAMAAAAFLLSSPAGATTYDAAADFSATTNGKGVWSYGFSKTFGEMTKYTLRKNYNKLDYWWGGGSLNTPNVIHNGTTSTVLGGGYLPYPTNYLTFHPGRYGEYSVIRWTAPTTGSYKISTTFTGANPYNTTTDVHVLDCDTELYASSINKYKDVRSYNSGVLKLIAGNTIDFVVGYGSNKNFSRDTTAIIAKISTVTQTVRKTMAFFQPSSSTSSPLSTSGLNCKVVEPATTLLLGLGLAGLGFWRKKRDI